MSYPGAKRYIVLDTEGKFDNLVIWDGASTWAPPEGCSIVLEDSDEGRSAVAAAAAEQAAQESPPTS